MTSDEESGDTVRSDEMGGRVSGILSGAITLH